jgi:23S rRNA (uracil1939-C5)-methyltransferase
LASALAALNPAGSAQLGDEVDVEIESIASGGEGVGRIAGRVVFVPFTAPGDRVRARISAIGRRHLRAEIVAVVAPSPARRAPRCRHFGECGGCDLQHVTAAAQREIKARIVRDALERIGGIAWDRPIEVRHAGDPGRRSRAELRIERRADGSARIGYLREHTHELCAIDECPVLVPELESAISDMLRGRIAIPTSATRAYLAAGDDGVALEFADANDASLGAAEVRVRVAGFEHVHGARDFFQSNRALVDALVEEAVGDARGDLALDLYCGGGLFSLPLARRFARVVGVEAHAGSVERARGAARANAIENATFEHADVARWLRDERDVRPDLVLLDPPRRGAGAEVIAAIAHLEPRAIRYVSCDPATLARDLGLLACREYALSSVVALDMFPETAHVETVAVLTRRDA